MSALSHSWLEDEDPRDLMRWAAAGTIVVAVHAAAIAGYCSGTSRPKRSATIQTW